MMMNLTKRAFVITLVFLLCMSQLLTAQEHSNKNKARVINSIEAKYDALTDLSDRIWSYEEIAFKETQSSEALASYAESQGFTVRRGVGEIPTAFTAEFGSGSPIIGILGEFDALPGLSQKSIWCSISGCRDSDQRAHRKWRLAGDY